MMKALAVLLDSKGQSSDGWMAPRLNVSRVSVSRWLRAIAGSLPEPEVGEGVPELEVDEMWQFLQETNTRSGSGQLMIALRREVLPGLSVIVLRTPSGSYGTQ